MPALRRCRRVDRGRCGMQRKYSRCSSRGISFERARKMRDCYLTLSILMVLCVAATPSQAQNAPAGYAEAATLKLIVETAEQICQQVPIEQKNSQVALSANADAKVNGLLRKLLDVGGGVVASSSLGSSSGVLQKDLADAIAKGNDCKVSVLKTLVPLLLPAFGNPPGEAPAHGSFASINEVITANGFFKKQGDLWIEYPPYSPGLNFKFNEVSRDSDYIYLSDPSRQKPGDVNNPMLVRLPTHGGAVQWSYTNPVVWMDYTFARPALK